MFTKKQQKTIEKARKLINDAEYVVIGAGSGLTASGGLSYTDEEFFANEYTPFLKKGYKTIGDGIANNWTLTKKNATTYWGYWANHINNIFYKPSQLKIYKDLYQLVKNKQYYVITTNCDGQFYRNEKGQDSFKEEKIFAMQGSYKYFQCQTACCSQVYDNKSMIDTMLSGFSEEMLLIKEEDIPICPRCGGLLVPNLRVDNYFVEEPHMVNRDKYIDFLNRMKNHKVVFLELGVGYNTPVIIRYPFEEMTQYFSQATLIRINSSHSEVNQNIKKKSISISSDIGEIISSLVS